MKRILFLLLFSLSFSAPSIITTSLPEGRVGEIYNAVIQGSCTRTCVFVVSGLPYGMIYYQDQTNLIITGIPQYGYNGNVTAKLIEEGSIERAEKNLTLNVVSPLFAESSSPPPIIPEREYEFQLRATGGKEPYSWSLLQGELPNGISLDSSGLISGVASRDTPAGAYNYLFEVTDTDGDASHLYVTFYVSYSQSEYFSESSGLHEILYSWQLLSFVILILTGGIIAVAIMLGKAFSIPTLTSWGNVEITQFFVTVFIVIGIVGILTSIDAIVEALLAGTPYEIEPGANLTLAVRSYGLDYLNSLINKTSRFASLAFDSNFEAAKKAYRRNTVFCTNLINLIPCFQFSASYAPNAYRELDVEYYSYVIGEYSNILTSLLAQKYFLDFAIAIGPILLFMGIVLRAFFATRSLGGTLMAMGIGLMYIYPLMYIFDEATVTITLYGPDMLTAKSSCPLPCSTPLPVAVRVTNGYNVTIFGSSKLESALGFLNSSELNSGEKASLVIGSSTYYSCENLSTTTNAYCLEQCRYIPYPIKESSCMDPAVQEACYNLRQECKIMLLDITYASTNQCPLKCKVRAPMQNDCSECIYKPGSTEASPSYCRYIYMNDNSVVPECDSELISPLCPDDKNNPFQSCKYIFNITNTDCNTPSTCESCPPWYRIIGLEEKPIEDSITTAIKESCATCPDECRVSPNEETLISELCNIPSCNSCPEQCRIRSKEGWLEADECNTEACQECPLECKSFEPPDEPCAGCLVADERELYYPPVQLECAELCREDQKETEPKIESFLTRGEGGTYGKPELKTLGSLMIAAYLLPLFNLFITVLFIKALSDFFGGEIELPGLQRVI